MGNYTLIWFHSRWLPNITIWNVKLFYSICRRSCGIDGTNNINICILRVFNKIRKYKQINHQVETFKRIKLLINCDIIPKHLNFRLLQFNMTIISCCLVSFIWCFSTEIREWQMASLDGPDKWSGSSHNTLHSLVRSPTRKDLHKWGYVCTLDGFY